MKGFKNSHYFLPPALETDLSVVIDIIEVALSSLLTTAARPYGTDWRIP